MNDGTQGVALGVKVLWTILRWAWTAFDSVADFVAQRILPGRRYEVRYTIAGALIGLLGGLPFGGMGLATAGGAIGLSISLVATFILGLVGNRVGVERDLRMHKQRPEREP